MTTREQENKVNEIKQDLDRMIDEYRTPLFIEVTGKMGGDLITYRVYPNGHTYER
jgi:hypothetical protein